MRATTEGTDLFLAGIFLADGAPQPTNYPTSTIVSFGFTMVDMRHLIRFDWKSISKCHSDLIGETSVRIQWSHS